MCEEDLPSSQLLLGEPRDRVGGSAGQADQTAVRGGDGEGEVGVRGVAVLRCQLLPPQHGGAARPHRQPSVVHYPRQPVVDRSDEEFEGGGNASLVLVRPLHPCRACHQQQRVL